MLSHSTEIYSLERFFMSCGGAPTLTAKSSTPPRLCILVFDLGQPLRCKALQLSFKRGQGRTNTACDKVVVLGPRGGASECCKRLTLSLILN